MPSSDVSLTKPSLPASGGSDAINAEPPGAEPLSADIEVADRELLVQLTGPSSHRLALLERQCGISVGLRGNIIRLQGPADAVFLAQRVLSELVELLRSGMALRDGDLEASIRLLRDHPNVKLADVFRQVIITSESGHKVAPRGLAQRYYVQAIDTHDVVFGVGPGARRPDGCRRGIRV
jgi:phosphate starvation-inducible PhoH-like protein